MAKQTPLIKFPEFAPDLTSVGTGVSNSVSGCVPQGDGYGPFRSLAELSLSLGAPCRGYFFARRGDNSVTVFAGTESGLFVLNATDLSWTNVSKGGLAYGSLVGTAQWQFAQFNDFVIAAQINTVPQKFVLSSGATFVDLGGSPPQASHVAIVNRFVLLTGLLSNRRRVQWSDLDAPEVWTAGVGLSDFQDLPDGGAVFGLSGGDAYGIAFQSDCIRSLAYAPGSAVTFQIVRISTEDSLFAPYSVINAGSRTFFLSAQGFKVIEPGGTPKAIGKERVDRYFFNNVDQGFIRLVIGATDPTGTRVYWSFKTVAETSEVFNYVLCFDWSIGENGRWSLLPIRGEYLGSLVRPGQTLEGLDTISSSIDALTLSLDTYTSDVAATLSAFSVNHKVGFFTGPNLEAVIDTSEQDLEGQTVFISGVRPMTDCATAVVSVGGRLKPQDAITFTAESPVGAYDGIAPQLIETRYGKARVRHPAGAAWTYSRGVQVDAQPAGER